MAIFENILNGIFGTKDCDIGKEYSTYQTNHTIATTGGTYSTVQIPGIQTGSANPTITYPAPNNNNYYTQTIITPVNTNNLQVPDIKDRYKVLISSEKAYFLEKEEDIIGLLNICMVEVSDNLCFMTGNANQKALIPFVDFLKQFRPDMYEKYKLLIEEK